MHFAPYPYFVVAAFLGIGLALAPDPAVGTPDEASAAAPSRLATLVALKTAEASTGASDRATPRLVHSRAAISADRAFEALVMSVAQQSHPEALRSAFEAYFNYREANPNELRKPYLYYVDFGLSSTEPRGYVFDMDALAVVEGPFTVAHGRGSAQGAVGIPTRFSNRPGSNATSLGLFLTQETYNFSGKVAGRGYRSVGLRLEGLSGGFNSAARRRGVVAHGAPYVTPDRAGRSEGCPAMEPDRAARLLPKIAGGSLVFLFSPYDREWLRLEPWTQEGLRYTMQLATN